MERRRRGGRAGGGLTVAIPTLASGAATSPVAAPDTPAPGPERPPASRWRSARARWDARYMPYLFIAPFFLLFTIFGVYPLVRTAWVSLFDWSLLGTHSFIGFDNYTQLMGDTRFWNAVWNTLGIFVLSTVPQLTLALVLAQ